MVGMNLFTFPKYWIMEEKMETTVVEWGNLGTMQKRMGTIISGLDYEQPEVVEVRDLSHEL